MELVSLHNGVLSRERFGVRAHRLSQVAAAGLRVPPGVVIANAEAAARDKDVLRAALSGVLKEGQLYALRASPGAAEWGGPYTLLALGMNDEVYAETASKLGAEVAAELYRRAIVTFAIAVKSLDGEPFNALLSAYSDSDKGYGEALLEKTKALYADEMGEDFPQNPLDQLVEAVGAMAGQWNATTSRILRIAKGAPADAHLALILQEMVHGLAPHSGIGRIQFHDPQTGARKHVGMFVTDTLSAAAAKTRFQWPIDRKDGGDESLEAFDSKAFDSLMAMEVPISRAIHDSPEVKFVVENGEIYITEVLLARRNARASLAILLSLVENGVIDREDAILRLAPDSIAEFLHPQIDEDTPRDILAEGLAASPGAASGVLVFHANDAVTRAAKGEKVILARYETGPEDIRGMLVSAGVVTAKGGMTSHAAVIARGLGVPCVVGADDLRIESQQELIRTKDGREYSEGDWITIDGTRGQVDAGQVELVEANVDEGLDRLLGWANNIRRMDVRVNADTPEDARRAARFGVDGIGLCRTEHMFFAEHRLALMREMIFASDVEERRRSLEALEPMQTDDFIELFQIMRGRPVTIRLLDPPLHEFLPHSQNAIAEMAKALNMNVEKTEKHIRALSEFNPMLGMRGVRLGIVYPEIYNMQARAIFKAAQYVNARTDEPVVPEIMIPLVSANREVEMIRAHIDKIAQDIAGESDVPLPYELGVMVETPRAALRAHDLAESCSFLSFGTNDLTQMTYGLSRDDAGRFMREYVQNGVYHEDPFHVLDREGVGELIREAVIRGREANEELVFGLCGEHGGDPSSVEFCETVGIDYVSCSPYRVPIAQLAAAQATIRTTKQKKKKKKSLRHRLERLRKGENS